MSTLRTPSIPAQVPGPADLPRLAPGALQLTPDQWTQLEAGDRDLGEFDCSLGFKFSTYACRAILKSFVRVGIKSGLHRARFPAGFNPDMECRSDHEDRKREVVESACVEEIRAMLLDNRAGLTETEQQVIRSRFMLAQSPPVLRPQTLKEVGIQMGVTKERVRQIQNQALRKLREALESGFLGDPPWPEATPPWPAITAEDLQLIV